MPGMGVEDLTAFLGTTKPTTSSTLFFLHLHPQRFPDLCFFSRLHILHLSLYLCIEHTHTHKSTFTRYITAKIRFGDHFCLFFIIPYCNLGVGFWVPDLGQRRGWVFFYRSIYLSGETYLERRGLSLLACLGAVSCFLCFFGAMAIT